MPDLAPAAPLERADVLVAAVAVTAVGLATAIAAPWLALALVAAVGALPLAAWLFRRPLAATCVALLGLVIVVETGEGLSLAEAAYALYYVSFLGYWFLTRVVVQRARVLVTLADRAVLLFLIGATLSIGWAPLFGASVVAALNEWYAVLMLAIYFPVREVCVRYRYGLEAVMGTLLIVVVFVALRNVLDYQTLLANAVQSYKLGRGRVVSNDCLLMSATTFVLVWAAFARTMRPRLILLACYSVCLAALIVTQSRTFWVTHALAAALLFAIAPASSKQRMLLGALVAGAAFFAGGYTFIGPDFGVVLFTMFNRLLTVQQALGGDISFLSRLFEAQGALEMIRLNPILGHGLAAQFAFYDILVDFTEYTSFVHIGYVGLWFTFGLWGVVLVLTFWIAALVQGARAYATRGASAPARVAGLAAALCLFVLLISNFASPVFELDDTIYMMGLLLGVAGGAHLRARAETSAPTL